MIPAGSVSPGGEDTSGLRNELRAAGDVYVAPPREAHRCVTQQWQICPERPVGSIYRCDCGRYWYCSNETDGLAPPTHLWKPVRWWHFKAKSRIAGLPVGEEAEKK